MNAVVNPFSTGRVSTVAVIFYGPLSNGNRSVSTTFTLLIWSVERTLLGAPLVAPNTALPVSTAVAAAPHDTRITAESL
jgi:hypothetical protein